MPDESAVTTTTTATTTTEPTVDKDALEIGELVKAAGFSKGDVNALTESAVSLASIRNLIENNPTGFLDSLEKANPDAAKKFHDKLAEVYVERYSSTEGDEGDGKDKGGDKKLTQEIKSLRERITANEASQQARDQAAAIAQVKSRYDARVNDLISQLPADLALTKTEREALVAKLNTDLAQDRDAIDRASKGNFIDVPKKFKELVDSWTNDKKAAAESEKAKREQSEKRGFTDLSSGPSFQITDAEAAKLTEGDDWETNIDAFAKALGK